MSKASFLKGVGHYGSVREEYGFATTMLQDVFTQRNIVAEFIRFKLIFIHKNGKFTF